MGFAIDPAPGRGNDDARSRHSSLPSSGTTPAASARTSSASSSLDGASDDGQHHQPAPRALPGHTLEMPSSSSRKHRSAGGHGSRLFQKLRTVLPVLTLTPRCGRMQVGSSGEIAAASSSSSSGAADAHLVQFSGAARPCRRVTGTLYGHRKGHVALALQETPRCLPSLVVELALQTHALLRELGNPAGARIVLETQRRAASDSAAEGKAGGGGRGGRRKRSHGPSLLDEPAWTMFCNGRKTGYAVRREATGEDLTVLETLRAVSMGAGVLPGRSSTSASAHTVQATTDDEVPYMRGSFDHFVGSRDSESLYMIAPQSGGTGPELAVFFVRL